jgi:cobalt/nickel transport system ATP-binding protein
MNEGPIVLRVESLGHSYPDGRQALTEVSFSLRHNERVGLIGPNGAGKTTLFLCLCGVLSAKRGMISIDGLDPQNPKDRKSLPAKVGVVFQNSDDQLFSPTVGEDVAFGPLNLGLAHDLVRERVAEALRLVGLEGFEDRVPFQLSGGEKRRTALAGVLAMHPEILLLDEPSMFLDARGRRGLIQLLNRIPGTKLIASHDLRLIEETCSRSILLDEGRVAADGPTAEILANAALMEEHGLER